jgi:hypothetical protein
MLIETKTPHSESEMKEFTPWMVNRGFSMDKGTVLYAELINRTNISPLMVHDFYLTALPTRRFYAKWAKAAKNSDDLIGLIQARHQCNLKTAQTYADLMSQDQIEEFIGEYSQGGPESKPVKKSKKTTA